MKSRISFFNGALFRKNVTRFAPAWVLYSVFLVLLMVSTFYGDAYNDCQNLSDLINISCGYSLYYALLVAQLLFGDLYNSRMCNALHALPMRRETWFGTHIITGLCFAIIPNLFASLFAAMLLGKYWIAAVYFLLGSSLSYLLFFGIAVFCVFCVGNRFAMVLVYGIVNLFVVALVEIINILYDPLVFGIELDASWLYWLCPVSKLIETEFLDVTRYSAEEMLELGLTDPITIKAENWWYLILCGLLGLALIAVALHLYRRRQLESAGDFVVVKPLAPVFLVLYTLAAGCLLYLLASVSGTGYFFLFLGIAIGFFTGLMLLNRTIRVFHKKAWLGFGAFATVMAVSLLLTWLDPIGFTRYVPDTEDVASVSITTNYWNNDAYITEQEHEIGDIASIHQHALDNRLYSSYNNGVECLDIYLTYTLKNGRIVRRTYYIYPEESAGQLLEGYMSRPEVVLGQRFTDFESYCADIERMTTLTHQALYQQEHIQSLLTAILADCEAGTMADDWRFHPDADSFWIDIEYVRETDENGITYSSYRTLRIWPEAENTMAWLEQNGLLDESVDWNKKFILTTEEIIAADIELS